LEGLWPPTCGCAPECSLSQVEDEAKRVAEAFEAIKTKHEGRTGSYEAHMAAIHINFADCLDNASLSSAYPEQKAVVEEQRNEHLDEALRLLEGCTRRAEPKWVQHCETQIGLVRDHQGQGKTSEAAAHDEGTNVASQAAELAPPSEWTGMSDQQGSAWELASGSGLLDSRVALPGAGLGLGAGVSTYGTKLGDFDMSYTDASTSEGGPCETRVENGGATMTLFFKTARPTASDVGRLAHRGVLRNFDQETLDRCVDSFVAAVQHAWEAAGGIGVEEMWSVVASTDHEAEYVKGSSRRERAIRVNREVRVRRAEYGKQIMLNLGSPRPIAAAEEVRLQHLLEDPPSTPWILPSNIEGARGQRYAEWRRDRRLEFEHERSVTIEYAVAASASGVIRHQIRAIPEEGFVDLVLVIDATGSMADDIEQVRHDSMSIFRQLHAKNPDARVGLVVYRDRGDGPGWRQLIQQPTDAADAFEEATASIQAMGGGDADEDVCAGQYLALDEIQWRPSSQRLILTIGDADPKLYDEFPTCDDVRVKSESVGVSIAPFHPLGRDVKGFLDTIGEVMPAAR
jgi:hypothetical protein